MEANLSLLSAVDVQKCWHAPAEVTKSAAPINPESESSEDDLEWAERSAHWEQQNVWKPRRRDQKRKVRNPLVLGGHGVRLRMDRGSLLVQNGFTHYPQQREGWRFFPGHPDLPSRIVVVDADGSITFDVLAWLSTQRIPLVQINWRGEAIVAGSPSGYVADFELVRAQRAAQASKRRTMAISRWLVAEKIGTS
jgi:CRISP-associated protein Cas1